MSYVGSDDEEELEMINYNVESDSKSESDGKSKENLFNVDIDKKIKVIPTINAKVVKAMKPLHALYNDNHNKIVKKAT